MYAIGWVRGETLSLYIKTFLPSPSTIAVFEQTKTKGLICFGLLNTNRAGLFTAEQILAVVGGRDLVVHTVTQPRSSAPSGVLHAYVKTKGIEHGNLARMHLRCVGQ